MFYLLHGNDEFTCREQLKKLKREEDYGYNQDFYTGGEVSLITLTATCNTFPFLTEKRLVVLEGLPKRKRGEEASDSEARAEQAEKPKKGKKGKASTETRAGFEKGLAEYIPQMPESTVLIVLVDEELSASSPILKAAQQHGKVIQCTLPKGQAIEGWIVKRAQSIGVKITPEAAKLLANELDKLATYVGERKVIDVEDVRRLSAQVQEARIFDLTDALAARDRKKALNLLHELLADGEPPLKLISTITSQVRSLLLVKELADEGLRIPQIVSATGMAPFIAEKALRQIGKFKAEQIETAYRQLLATDAALKRSRLTPEMALDLLVVNFGNA